MKEEIERGNILIAEFMGWKVESSCVRLIKFKYHKSWNALMPVITKILDITSENDEMEKYNVIIDQIPQLWHTYEAVIDFVENYKNK